MESGQDIERCQRGIVYIDGKHLIFVLKELSCKLTMNQFISQSIFQKLTKSESLAVMLVSVAMYQGKGFNMRF